MCPSENEKIIVFLSGKQRAGKDTAADYLKQYYGFRKYSLADGVREIARTYFGMQEKDRGLLIKIGLAMREIDPDVWIKYLWKEVTWQFVNEEVAWQFADEVDRIVIPDVRFPNEFAFFKEQGGIGIRIVANPEIRALRQGYDAQYENDVTEKYLENEIFDYCVYNNGGPGSLYNQLDNIMKTRGVDLRWK